MFSNMLAGHTLLAILSSFLLSGLLGGGFGGILSSFAILIFSLLVTLEVAVSGIQAYVFGVLISSYMEGALKVCCDISLICVILSKLVYGPTMTAVDKCKRHWYPISSIWTV